MNCRDISSEHLELWLRNQSLSQEYVEAKAPASRLICEFRAIQRAKQVPLVKVQLRLIDQVTIELFEIKTARKQRDRGYGTSALGLLGLLADRHRVTLVVDICPADDCGLGLGDLMEWYGKQSFVGVDEDDRNPWLTRSPQNISTQRAEVESFIVR